MTSLLFKSIWVTQIRKWCVLLNCFAQRSLALLFLASLFSCATVAQNSKSFPVSYEGEVLFSLSLDLPEKSAKERAEEASKLLTHAIEANDVDDSPQSLVSIESDPAHFLLYVRGGLITAVYMKDVNAKDHRALLEHADLVMARVKTVVARELERQQWQSIALKFFVSVILLILGVFVLRQLKNAFDRLEIIFVERQDVVRKFRIFGRPFFKHESVAGVFAFLSEVLRWIAYIAVVTIILVTFLGQFELTKGFLKSVGRTTVLDLAHAVQRATTAIPGVVLALLILLSLHIAVHAFNLMLDGLKGQKLKGRAIPYYRIPVLKTVAPAILSAIFIPLAIGAFFQQWNTPTQWLIVGASFVALLGALPVLANWLCGSILMWRNELSLGNWLSINGIVGEVASINTMFLHVVPLGGGTVAIPMLKVFLSPIKKFATAPKETIDFEISCSEDMEGIIKELTDSVRTLVHEVEIKPVSLAGGRLHCRISFPLASADTRTRVIFQIIQCAKTYNIALIKDEPNA